MMAGGQVWLGSYICTQGETGLQLEIVDVSPAGVVNALFSFDTANGAATGCTGRYQMSGRITEPPAGSPAGTARQLTMLPEDVTIVGVSTTAISSAKTALIFVFCTFPARFRSILGEHYILHC